MDAKRPQTPRKPNPPPKKSTPASSSFLCHRCIKGTLSSRRRWNSIISLTEHARQVHNVKADGKLKRILFSVNGISKKLLSPRNDKVDKNSGKGRAGSIVSSNAITPVPATAEGLPDNSQSRLDGNDQHAADIKQDKLPVPARAERYDNSRSRHDGNVQRTATNTQSKADDSIIPKPAIVKGRLNSSLSRHNSNDQHAAAITQDKLHVPTRTERDDNSRTRHHGKGQPVAAKPQAKLNNQPEATNNTKAGGLSLEDLFTTEDLGGHTIDSLPTLDTAEGMLAGVSVEDFDIELEQAGFDRKQQEYEEFVQRPLSPELIADEGYAYSVAVLEKFEDWHKKAFPDQPLDYDVPSPYEDELKTIL